MNRPDGVTVEYLYEGDNDSRLPLPNPNTGRLKKIVQPRGDTTFGYDTAGRLANITAPDGGLLSYAYDGSLLLSTTWSNGKINGSVSRTYDNNFWVTSESVNGGNTVGFTYDLDGLLTGANTTVNGSAVNFVIARDPDNGLITGSSIGGVSDSISYNGFAEPIGYTATYNGTNTLYDVSYVRDAIGRISSKTETVNGVTTTYGYHYDLAGRLTGVDENGVPSSTYTYDSNGNRLSYTKGSTTLNGTYDAQDRLLSYGDFVYEYTANGELRRKENVVTGEVWEYEYDPFGNLIKVVLPSGTLVEYVIDGKERRIGKCRFRSNRPPVSELIGQSFRSISAGHSLRLNDASVILLFLLPTLQILLHFAHRFTLEFDAVGVVHEPVQDGVRESSVTHERVP